MKSYFKLIKDKGVLGGDLVYMYTGAKSKDRLFVAFTDKGIRFYKHTDASAGYHYLGCVLYLPFSLDSDFNTSITKAINSIFTSLSKSNIDEFGYTSAWEFDNDSLAAMLSRFIYEFERTSTFHSCEYYEKAYESLHKCHLFNAITAKADYYYQRAIQDMSLANTIDLDSYSRSERRWAEIIMDPTSELLFHESPWFSETVDELNCLYESDRSCLDISNILESVSPQLSTRISDTASMSLNWFMSEYRPDGVMRIRNGALFKWSVIGVIVSLVLLSFIVWTFPFVDSCSILYKAYKVAGILCCVSIGAFYFIPGLIRSNKKRTKVKTMQNLIMPRLIAGIAAGWMTIGLSDIVSILTENNTFDHRLPSLAILLFLFMFIYFSVRKIHPYPSNKYVPILVSVYLLSISTIYSVVIGCALFFLYSPRGYTFSPLTNQDDAGILLIFSMLSMFVGIFIQLLVQNTSISSVGD